MRLANGLPCANVCKCKDYNHKKQDEESDCNDLVEEEENVYYDSDYSDDSEFEYIKLI